MNKKFKKMIATVSAIAMCATSFVSMGADAKNTWSDKKVNEYTNSFISEPFFDKLKFEFSQEITNYFGLEDDERFFISEPVVYTDNHNMKEYAPYLNIEYNQYMVFKYEDQKHILSGIAPVRADGFSVLKEDLSSFEEYLNKNDIPYIVFDTTNSYSDFLIAESEGKYKDNDFSTIYVGNSYYEENDFVLSPVEMRLSDAMSYLKKIKEDTGYIYHFWTGESTISIENIENSLPEPTLTGDATEDGEVNIADAVLIMQSLSNPNEYKLTPQGMANADMDGDGVTALDALTIQQMLLNK